MTLEAALGEADGTTPHSSHAGGSMLDAARASLAGSQGVNHTARSIADVAQNAGTRAGRLAVAASLSVTMAMNWGKPVQAAIPPAMTADGPANARASRSGPLMPIGRDSPRHQEASRPPMRDKSASTATPDKATAARRIKTSGTSQHAPRRSIPAPIASPFDAARIGPGFEAPSAIHLPFGRLAQEISENREHQPLVRVAALKHAMHKQVTHKKATHKHVTHKRSAHKHAAGGKRYKATRKARTATHVHGRIAAGHAKLSCLPSDLKRVLNEVAANFGAIRINSTYRSPSHNRRVGGAPRSLHLECRAVDFSYRGPRRGALIRFLRSHSGVGGVGVYGGSGHIHIDDGPRRSW